MIHTDNQSFSFPRFAHLLLGNRKKAGLYALLFIVVAIIFSLVLPVNGSHPAADRANTSVQLFCFTVMGIGNAWLLYQGNMLAAFSVTGTKLAFTCLLFILMVALLLTHHLITDNPHAVMAVASPAAFLLPFIVWEGWINFEEIPTGIYPLWYPSATDEGLAPATAVTAINSMQVQLKILRRVKDLQPNTFPLTTSAKTKLGRLFDRFIADSQLHGSKHAIDTATGSNDQFGWRFYEEKWKGLYRKSLHPSKSLLENRIKANARIAAVRTVKYN